MATMIPAIPADQLPPGAERKVYESLQRLPDAYRVYHSLAYYVLPSGGHPLREGEIDFLILHPDLGLLVLEIKGGEISYEGRERTWKSIDASGHEHDIKDPFLQAQQNVKNLIALIEKAPGRGETRFTHGHAVGFPDCEYKIEREPLGARPELVLDCHAFAGNIEESLRRLYGLWSEGRKPEALGTKGVKKLGQEFLAPRFGLVGITLGSSLEWEESALKPLEEEQRVCLDFLEMNPRAVIEGGSGTGKTTIACELVRSLAASGERVLFLCFNLPLAHHLRRVCASFGEGPGMVWAGAYHQLAREWAAKAEIPWSEPSGRNTEETAEFWSTATSMLLLDAIEKIPDRFDSLVVDEAQDFATDWWCPLLGLLANKDEGRIVLFSDPAQDLWDRGGKLPVERPIFPLRVNRRNTRQIFSFLTRFGGTKLRTSHQAPLGDPPEVIRHRTAGEQRENIDKKLGWLLKGGVSLDQIVLIGTHRLEKSFLADRPTLYGLPVEAIRDDGTATSEGALRYSTPHRFKGLESKVVLLCDVDGNEKSCAKRHLYVAASRAQHLLYVFAQHGAVSGLELGEGEPQS
jgi:hypothetical protein